MRRTIRARRGPAADGLFVGTSERYLYKLETKSGNVVQRLELSEPARGTPLFDGQHVFVRLGRSTMAAISTDLKRVVWQRATAGRWMTNRPILVGDIVVCGNSRGELSGLRAHDGTTAWRAEFAGEEIRSVSEMGGTYFVGTLDGTVYSWHPSPQATTTSRPTLRLGRLAGGYEWFSPRYGSRPLNTRMNSAKSAKSKSLSKSKSKT